MLRALLLVHTTSVLWVTQQQECVSSAAFLKPLCMSCPLGYPLHDPLAASLLIFLAKTRAEAVAKWSHIICEYLCYWTFITMVQKYSCREPVITSADSVFYDGRSFQESEVWGWGLWGPSRVRSKAATVFGAECKIHLSVDSSQIQKGGGGGDKEKWRGPAARMGRAESMFSNICAYLNIVPGA